MNNTEHIMAYPNNPALGCKPECKACAYDEGYDTCQQEWQEKLSAMEAEKDATIAQLAEAQTRIKELEDELEYKRICAVC